MIKSDDKALIGPSLKSHICCNTFILLKLLTVLHQNRKRRKKTTKIWETISKSPKYVFVMNILYFEISCCWPHANTSFDSIQRIFVFLSFHSHLFGDMRRKRAVKNNSFFFKKPPASQLYVTQDFGCICNKQIYVKLIERIALGLFSIQFQCAKIWEKGTPTSDVVWVWICLSPFFMLIEICSSNKTKKKHILSHYQYYSCSFYSFFSNFIS